MASAIESNYDGNFKQHSFVKLVAMDAIGGQSAVPEAG
jgi:hypothetical protein